MYEIFSGPKTIKLPAVVQIPDCGLEFDDLMVSDLITNIEKAIVQSAIKLDRENKELVL